MREPNPPNGYLTTTQSAQRLGISLHALNSRVKRYNKKHPNNPIKQYAPESGDVYRYYKETDLTRLVALVEVQEAR